MNAQGDRPELSVLVPMYNEGESVSRSMSRFVKTLEKPGVDWGLIPVNDGSTDDTLSQLEQLHIHAKGPLFRFVNYTKNRERD